MKRRLVGLTLPCPCTTLTRAPLWPSLLLCVCCVLCRESARECRRRQRAHAEELAGRVASLEVRQLPFFIVLSNIIQHIIFYLLWVSTYSRGDDANDRYTLRAIKVDLSLCGGSGGESSPAEPPPDRAATRQGASTIHHTYTQVRERGSNAS